LAEIGDKTQIAAMTMAAEKKRPWEVLSARRWRWCGFGNRCHSRKSLSQYLPLEWIKRVAEPRLFVIGVLILMGRF